jgi:hypothetical protein
LTNFIYLLKVSKVKGVKQLKYVLVPQKSVAVYLFLLLEVHLAHIFTTNKNKLYELVLMQSTHTQAVPFHSSCKSRRLRFLVGAFTKNLFACFSEFTYNSENVKEKRSSYSLPRHW